MTDPVQRLANAEAEAVAARERLSSTIAMLQARLNPQRVARDAARNMVAGGGAAVKASVDTARGNPGALAGVTALAGLFLARHRIASLFNRARGHDDPSR